LCRHYLVDEYFIENISRIRANIKELWLSCDTDQALPKFKVAVKKLTNAGFNRNKISCYALVGVGKDMEKDEARLREIYNAGAMPYAMLYRDFSDTKTVYNKDYERFVRQWIRPAAIKAHMEKGTHYRDFTAIGKQGCGVY